MEQLAERKGLQHPAPEPPGPLPLDLAPGFIPPHEASVLGHVPAELERAEDGEQRDGHAEVLGWVNPQHQAREGRPDGGRVGRRQGGGRAGVAVAEGLGAGVEEVGPQAGEEAEEEAVEEEDRGQREGESEGLGLVEGLLLCRCRPELAWLVSG